MKKLYEGNIYKNFILFAIPMVLGGVLSKLYEIIDTVIAGVFLGDKALASIGALSPFTQFISCIFWGGIPGFGAYCALLFGKGENEKIRDATNTFLCGVFVLSIIIEIICFVFVKDFLILFKADTLIIDDAIKYFRVYIISFFFMQANLLFFTVFNSMGIGNFPFIIEIISTVLNITGNILFITVFKLGVKGLAISTVISTAVCFVMYFIKYIRCIKELKIPIKFVIKIKLLKEPFGYYAPPCVQQFLMYFASMFLSPMVNGLGYYATAVYTITSLIRDIIAQTYQNASKVLSNYVGQSLGALKYKNIKYSIFVAIIQLFIFTMPLILLCIIIPQNIVKLFLQKDYEVETLIVSANYLRYFLPLIMFNAINNLFHNLYRAVKGKWLLMLSSFIGCVSRIIFTYILTPSYGMYGFFGGWIISYVVEAIMCGIVYSTKIWMPKELKNYYKNINSQSWRN